MTFLYLLAPILAFILLGAHFMRASNAVGVIVALFMLALLMVRRPFAARVEQLGLVLAAAEWVRTAVVLVQERSAIGAPYIRAASILGGVALFTLLAALVFTARPVNVRYRLAAGKSPARETPQP